MRLAQSVSRSGRSPVGRIRRWLIAWLIVAALLAVLLLANSVRDYFFVWRIIAVQQVRHQMSGYVVALEQSLRHSSTSTAPSGEFPTAEFEETAKGALWFEVRRSDGSVLARHGNVEGQVFTAEEESSHFRSRQPLYKIVPSSGGEVVVEVFPVYDRGLASSAGPAGSAAAGVARGPRSLLTVEIAERLAIREPSVLWPIRQNLVINCAGALALLATVIIAALAFRSYERRRWLEAQLEIAREVQSALLPSRTDDYEPVRLAAFYRPAEQVGGDFYDVFRAENGRIAIVIGDVSGKGVPAALLTGVIHGAVRSAGWTESGARHERESEQLNRLLCDDASGGRYASMFWCYYDSLSSLLHYVNAGHLPPILLRRGDRGTDPSPLDTGGPVLGVLGGARYEQGRRELRPGDILVLYSDGLIEATNSAGEEYGVDRLRERVKACGHSSPHEIRDAIVSAVGDFMGAVAPRDDLTLVVASIGSPY
ncbi:MAG: PP2C family protein-serine/threonine phosphatase [Acidobacteriota bacterium]